jgi:hypothetical protein
MRKLVMRWKKPAPEDLVAAATGASVESVRRQVRGNDDVATFVVTVVGCHYRAKDRSVQAHTTVRMKHSRANQMNSKIQSREGSKNKE